MNAQVAREKATELRHKRAQAKDELHAINERSSGPLSAGDQERWDRLIRQVEKHDIEIAELDEIRRKDIADGVRSGRYIEDRGPEFMKQGPADPWNARGETRSLALSAAEKVPASDDVRQKLSTFIENDESPIPGLAASWALRTSAPAYRSAFRRLIRDPLNGHRLFDRDELEAFQAVEEIRGMVVGTNTGGGYLVPSFLDPAIVLTNSGSSNIMRGVAKVVNLTHGNVYTGITSAGVDASWDAELAVVSDDSPQLASVTVPVFKGQAFIRASFETLEDTNIDQQVAELFADAKDRLEWVAFMTGNGTTAAEGVFTTLAATTTSRLVSTTAATIGLTDLQSLYRQLPVRWRKRGLFLMNPLYRMAIQALGTAVSASFTTDLTQPPTDYLFGKAVLESDDAPSTQTTTALDSEIAFFDPNEYLVVDKIGAQIEFIPNLFDGSSGRPTGERGFLMHWRAGGKITTASAGDLLVDKTSA